MGGAGHDLPRGPLHLDLGQLALSGLDPTLQLAVVAAAVAAGACWAASVLTREYSWTDRVWSVMPPIYGWIFAAGTGFAPRPVLVAALITAWGARLTFNFWRKGGYAPGGEDYRWAVLKDLLPGWAWPLFNVAFIAGYQHALILGFTLPAWRLRESTAPLGPLDALFALLFLLFLAGETLADQQQWVFHQHKRAAQAEGRPTEPFLTTGFFRWSRHPNFLCEQAQWWVLTLFPLAAGLPWAHWTVGGAVLLTLLFDGSTRFTEWITRSKYPTYATYQQTTSRWIPWPPRAPVTG